MRRIIHADFGDIWVLSWALSDSTPVARRRQTLLEGVNHVIQRLLLRVSSARWPLVPRRAGQRAGKRLRMLRQLPVTTIATADRCDSRRRMRWCQLAFGGFTTEAGQKVLDTESAWQRA